MNKKDNFSINGSSICGNSYFDDPNAEYTFHNHSPAEGLCRVPQSDELTYGGPNVNDTQLNRFYYPPNY